MCILHCHREKARLWTFSNCFNLSLNLLMANLNVYTILMSYRLSIMLFEYYVNCGHTNEMKLHCDCYLSNFLLQLSSKNVFGVSTQFEPMASALAQQCSTNWARKTHTLGAGQFIEFIVPVKGMKQMNITTAMITSSFHSYVGSSHNIHMIHFLHRYIFICFIPFMGTMNSTNWPAPNIWVFIAQLVQYDLIPYRITKGDIISLDSEDGLRTGCRNVSHKQQSFSGLQPPRWLFSIKVSYSWVH